MNIAYSTYWLNGLWVSWSTDQAIEITRRTS